jgi:hypothetical protein
MSFRLELANITRVKVHPNKVATIHSVIKVLAGLALLILSVWGIDVNRLVAGIRSADLSWLILAPLLVILGLGFKLFRWRMILHNYHVEVNISRLFSAYFVSQAINIVLPLRGGEVVRLGYFAENMKIIPQVASSIILEKYFDLVALTIVSILVSFSLSVDNIFNLRSVLLPSTIIVSLALIFFILLGPALCEKLSKYKFLPQRLVGWMGRLVQVNMWLKNPARFLPGVLLTGFIWVVMWLTNLALFTCFGLPLGGTAAGLVLVLVYISLLPALMPGNIGPFYFSASLALIPFGILHDQALPFVVVLHAIVTLPPLLCGAVGLLIHSKHSVSA